MKFTQAKQFLYTILILSFLAACSSSNNAGNAGSSNNSNSNQAPNSGQSTSIVNASAEDKRAIVALLELTANLTGNPSTTSSASSHGFALPFVSTAHANAIGCSGGGNKYATITSPAESLNAVVQADDSLRLDFNNFTVDMLFDQCKSAISERCNAVYKVDGNILGTINGSAVKRGTNSEYNNIRGQTRSSGTCSGLTIDTSSALNNPRSAGVDIRSTINGTQTATSSISSLVQYTGTICIGNTTWLINSQDDIQRVKETLCGF